MDNKLALVVQFGAVDRLSGALRNIMGLGRSGSAALRSLQGEARGTQRELGEVQRALAGASGNVTQLVNRERQLEAQLARTNRAIEQQRRNLETNARADAIRQRGADLQQRGQDNVVAGGVISAPVILAVRGAGEFSSVLEDIRQKADASDPALRGLSDNIMNLAHQTRLLPSQAAQAIDVLTGKGLQLSQAMDMAGVVGRVSTAWKVDVADAADAAYAAVQNLGISTDQVNTAMGVFAVTGREGSFEMRGMARHLNGLTARLKQTGEQGLESAANLGAALQVAMRTAGTEDEAANNIANLMDTLNNPETIERFAKRAGVDLPRALERLRQQGYSTFEAIAMITQEATGGDAEKIGQLFGDRQARQGLLALVQNLEEFRRIRQEALAGGNTAVAQAFDSRVMNDATVKWRELNTSLQALAITFGARLLPSLTATIDRITMATDWIGRWAQANPGAAEAIITTVAALAAMRVTFGALQFALGTVLGPLASIYKLFRRVQDVGLASTRLGKFVNVVIRGAGLLGRAFAIIKAGAIIMAQGLMRAGVMMLANPMVLAITLLVAAVAGAAYLIYRNWDRIKAVFSSWPAFFEAAKGWAMRGATMIVAALLGPFGNALPLVRGAWNVIKTGFNEGINWLRALPARLGTMGRQIIAGLIGGMTGNPLAIVNAMRSVVRPAISEARRELQVRSPSRVFMEIGDNVAQGLALGMVRGRSGPITAARGLAAGLAGAAALSAPSLAAAASPFAIPGSANASGTMTIGSITIHVHAQPGQSADEIARSVMERIRSEAARAGRSSYEDR